MKVYQVLTVPAFALLLQFQSVTPVVALETPPADLFQKLDTNQDGFLTADEVDSAKKSQFERVLRHGDQNNDGKLTSSEFSRGLEEPKSEMPPLMANQPGNRMDMNPGVMFQTMDRNNDGKLTKEELPEQAQERFGRLFTRLGKKEITRAEFETFVTSMRQNGGNPNGNPPNKEGQANAVNKPKNLAAGPNADGMDEMNNSSDMPQSKLNKINSDQGNKTGNKPGDKPGTKTNGDKGFGNKIPEGKNFPGKGDTGMKSGDKPGQKPVITPDNKQGKNPQGMNVFAKIDRDGDGLISMQEAPEMMKNNFSRIDQNKDGKICPVEMQAAREAMQKNKK
jgi:Ca2+-binding EF-hand superfamily protein